MSQNPASWGETPFSDNGGFTQANPTTMEDQSGSTLSGVLIGLLSSLGSALLIALIFALYYFFRHTQPGRILLSSLGRPGEYDDESAFLEEESRFLETADPISRGEYLRAKAFIAANPPESLPTDISLSQYLAIQEKGVSAWEFEPELEIANCFVEGRTEIEFFDSEGCCVMSNLPVPKLNEVYYWESKIYEKPEGTLLSIGMATKPYPLFRLPGWHKFSVAYTSDGNRRHNQSFTPTSYGPAYVQGDVIGVGYRPRTGTVFFTRNGKKLEDVAHGLKSQNLFPSVGANGPCVVHVNFGQSGFVFIEANVKKWGLAPMTGSLAPPPPYGSEQGSILLETGRDSTSSPANAAQGSSYWPDRGHGRSQSGGQAFRFGVPGQHGYGQGGGGGAYHPTSPGPQRSPTDISLAQLAHVPSQEVLDVGEGPSASASANAATARPAGPTAAAVADGLGIFHSNVGASGAGTLHLPPPPEYTSPPASRRNSDDSSTSGNPDDRHGAETSDERTPLVASSSSSNAQSRPRPSTRRSSTRRHGWHGTPSHRATQSTSSIPTPDRAVFQDAERSPPIPSYNDTLERDRILAEAAEAEREEQIRIISEQEEIMRMTREALWAEGAMGMRGENNG